MLPNLVTEYLGEEFFPHSLVVRLSVSGDRIMMWTESRRQNLPITDHDSLMVVNHQG